MKRIFATLAVATMLVTVPATAAIAGNGNGKKGDHNHCKGTIVLTCGDVLDL